MKHKSDTNSIFNEKKKTFGDSKKQILCILWMNWENKHLNRVVVLLVIVFLALALRLNATQW